ncbi:MAG: folate-binding protein YgfZ [Gammaproteobacteria bacterium]
MNADDFWRQLAGDTWCEATADTAPGDALKSPLDLAIVAVRGADARAFLHAQFAADLRTLSSGDAVLTAWCSPKGRVLFAPTVLAVDDGFVLLVDPAQADDLVRRLRMYVLRSQVEVEDLGASWAGIRTSGLAPAAATGLVVAREGELCWYLGPQQAITDCWPTLPAAAVGPATARLDAIRRGRPRLGPATADQFLPQELDLDRGRGVSFDKGCYPGQEIVARVRYRGSVKRRLARLASAQALAPGDRLVDADGDAPRATVVDAVALAGTWEALAVLDVDATLVAPATRPDLACRILERAPTAVVD